MTIEVQMLARRPKGPGEWYEKGVTYLLTDDLAIVFVRNGVARRTSFISERKEITARLQPSGKRYDIEDGLITPVGMDAASGVMSNGRSSVEKTLLVGAYADQSFAPDDFTLSATGVACAQRGYLTGVELLAGTGVTLTLQDSPDAASGRAVWSIPATSAPRRWDFPKPLPFHTGLYATIGGTSPSVKFLFGGRE